MITHIEKGNKKMFAILNSHNLVIDCWIADSLEEAQQDNPNKIVIEATEENSPFYLNQVYSPGKEKQEWQNLL
jgi:hypothetical protein